MQRARCATAGPASIMCIFSESNGSERQGGVVVGGGGGVSPTQTLLARGRACARQPRRKKAPSKGGGGITIFVIFGFQKVPSKEGRKKENSCGE